MAPEHDQHTHWPLLMLRACCKSQKVVNNDVPTWITTVAHVRGDGESDLHGGTGHQTVSDYGDGCHAQNTSLNLPMGQ